MKRALIVAMCLIILCGCIVSKKETVIVPESQKHFLIPAGTTFQARIKKNGPVVDVVLEWDAWVVSAGYMVQLHKDANREALGLPD